jgi:hypothetical protein
MHVTSVLHLKLVLGIFLVFNAIKRACSIPFYRKYKYTNLTKENKLPVYEKNADYDL